MGDLCLQVLGEQLDAKPDGTYWMSQLKKFFCQALPLPKAEAKNVYLAKPS